uniref:Uncharacterized protein n=1 Tax=Fagus sylvatica TaxID=28930 RepID=A0A2N9HYY0_FAGSY
MSQIPEWRAAMASDSTPFNDTRSLIPPSNDKTSWVLGFTRSSATLMALSRTAQGCAAVPHHRVREIVTRDGLIPGFEWLKPQTDYLSFVGTAWSLQWVPRPSPAMDVWWASGLGISSSSSVFRLPYSWVPLFKTLLTEEPQPHPNQMANSI